MTQRARHVIDRAVGLAVRNGLRLRYQHTGYGGDPQNVDELIGIVTTPMHISVASAIGSPARPAGAGAASCMAVHIIAAGSVDVPCMNRSTNTPPSLSAIGAGVWR